MGMYINDKGQLDYRSGNEGSSKESSPKPLIDSELLGKAREFAKDVGGTAVKATGAAVVGGGVGVGVSAGGSTAIAAGIGGIGVAVVASEIMREQQEGVDVVPTIDVEEARGGVPLQQVMASNSSREIADEAMAAQEGTEEMMDPFEAFRQCMQHAGMETASDINSNTACLPQKEARNNEVTFTR